MHTSKDLSRSVLDPFHQQLDPEVFFPGAQREDICQALILDLLTGKQFLHLSGQSGSGKSLICRVIMERLPSSFTPIYLESPTGSYEDLLRHACLDLGASRRNKADDFSWPSEFNRQLRQRQGDNGRVVLILDQAEQIFSAALERLLQRNRQASTDEPDFAILLAGSSGLSNLLDQLAALGPEHIPEKAYSLPPLDRAETEKYLRYRLHAAGFDWDEHDSILDNQSISRIVKQAQGNIALINATAGHLLANRLPLPAPATTAAPIEKPLPSLSPQKEELLAATEQADAEDSFLRWEELIAPPLIELYELIVGNKKFLGAILGVAMLLVGFGLFLDQRHRSTSFEQEQTAQITPAQQISSGDVRAVQAVAQGIEQPGRPSSVGSDTPSQAKGANLLQERLTASTALVAAAYRGASTIQLLTLSGSDAEERIASLLNTPLFVQEAKHLYIVRKRSTPPAYFIFYGIFDSLEQARQIRNNMSFELRAHHPYPLAITDALLLNEG